MGRIWSLHVYWFILYFKVLQAGWRSGRDRETNWWSSTSLLVVTRLVSFFFFVVISTCCFHHICMITVRIFTRMMWTEKYCYQIKWFPFGKEAQDDEVEAGRKPGAAASEKVKENNKKLGKRKRNSVSSSSSRFSRWSMFWFRCCLSFSSCSLVYVQHIATTCSLSNFSLSSPFFPLSALNPLLYNIIPKHYVFISFIYHFVFFYLNNVSRRVFCPFRILVVTETEGILLLSTTIDLILMLSFPLKYCTE